MPNLISVVMSTYNRENMVLEAVNSILNQTFDDFEFIIIDDGSDDNTCDLIKQIKDSRIKLLKNKKNCGCTFNYHLAQNIARGKYIVHIDDDDISYPDRLKKQLDFMENHPEITLSGTFIETFGEGKRPSWVFYTTPDKINFSSNFYNPICHSSIIYRKSFMDKNSINYDLRKKCAQDYDFYKQILFAGGKLANLKEILVKYRMHKKRLTDIKETQDIQIYNADITKKELLSRYLDEKETEEFLKLITDFPFNKYNIENVIKAMYMLKNKTFDLNHNEIEEVINDIKNYRFNF